MAHRATAVGVAAERAADRELLLLPAGKCSSKLFLSFRQYRESRKHSGNASAAGGLRAGADRQVLLDGQLRKNAAPLGHVCWSLGVRSDKAEVR